MPIGYRGRFWKGFGILTKYGYFIVTTQIMLWKKIYMETYTWRKNTKETLLFYGSWEVGRQVIFSPFLHFGFIM